MYFVKFFGGGIDDEVMWDSDSNHAKTMLLNFTFDELTMLTNNFEPNKCIFNQLSRKQ